MQARSQILFLRSLFLLLAASAVFLLLSSRVEAGPPPGPTTIHVVQAGDTLWEIAGEVAEPGSDLRKTVALLQEMNGLQGGGLQVGQRLVIPAGS